jgi:hypothetical protein
MNTQKPKWLRMNGNSLPPPRVGGALFLNSKDQSAILFGGMNSSKGILNDLWLSNGLNWEQREASNGPMARHGMGLTWDEARQTAVLFGGRGCNELLGDTWLFNGIEWIQQQPLVSPCPRTNASMAYDAARTATILFGGEVDSGKKFLRKLNETWVWNGRNWLQQFPTNLPPARSAASLVYDGARRSILLFGGGTSGGLLDDTWVWNGVDWIEQQPLHRPPARADFGMTYHIDKQQVILFGGQSHGGLATDTWSWDGKDWTQLQTSQSPSPQVAFGARLVYVPSLKVIVLYNAFREKMIVSDESFTIIERSEVWVLEY